MMDYIELMKDALDYIEDNLFEDINHKKLAGKVFLSEYHFWRIFYALSNYSVKEYIEKRRMSKILDLLEYTDKKLIDIAFECGYNSHEVFSRGFRRNYGITPRAFRKNPINIERFTKLDLVERNLLNHRTNLLVEFQKLDVERTKIYGIRIKTHDYSKECYDIRQQKWDFAMKYMDYLKDHTYYIFDLEPTDSTLDAEFFLGFDGAIDEPDFEEMVINAHTCISIDYIRGFEIVNLETDSTIESDVHKVITQFNYRIDDSGIRAIEVYTYDYVENGRYEMRVPIIEE